MCIRDSTKVQVVCAIGQWAETGLDSTVMNQFKESDTTPTDASIITFHVKVQAVCTIGQWTDCCRVVDDASHNDAKEAHRACWKRKHTQTISFAERNVTQNDTKNVHYRLVEDIKWCIAKQNARISCSCLSYIISLCFHCSKSWLYFPQSPR